MSLTDKPVKRTKLQWRAIWDVGQTQLSLSVGRHTLTVRSVIHALRQVYDYDISPGSAPGVRVRTAPCLWLVWAGIPAGVLHRSLRVDCVCLCAGLGSGPETTTLLWCVPTTLHWPQIPVSDAPVSPTYLPATSIYRSNVVLMVSQRDAGPPLKQHWINISSLSCVCRVVSILMLR